MEGREIVASLWRGRQEERASIRAVTGLVVAARYLTIVPVPGPVRPSAHALGRAAPWFPIIGLGIGAGLAVTDRAAQVLFPLLLAGLITVTAWKLVTGGLHLDGLADCLDGLGGSDAEHRLAIMRDSRIGAFGALGLILLLLLEIAAVTEMPPSVRARALLVVPVVARATPPLLARLFRPARHDGQGAAFGASVGALAVPIALAIALVVAVAALRVLGLAVLAVSVASALVVARFFAARFSGITGDVLGAAIEVAELTGLLTVSAWSHAGR
jgi:adenosylcobinamide-GDP ribazoletransferase